MTHPALLRRLAAGALVVSAVVPSEVVGGGPIICPFRVITGRPCPSCGMTRSWSAMGHGRLREAGEHHLFGPITFAAALAVVVGGEPFAASLLEPNQRARTSLGLLAAAWSLAWAWRLATTPGKVRR